MTHLSPSSRGGDPARIVELMVDGRATRVPAGVSVAAMLLDMGVTAFRTSVSGQPRGPLCGMGICHECRLTIDGVPHRRSCLVPVRAGMSVITSAPSAA